jgi:Fe-Mn family superoxide dismutase
VSDPKPTLVSRRQVLAGAAAASAVLVVSREAAAAEKAKPSAPAATPPAAKPGPIVLPTLPYPPDALAPVISANTLSFHYGKHHQAYVDKTNELIAGTSLAAAPLEEIIKASATDPAKTALFNNSAQVFNHTFYWQSLKPKGGGAPTGKLLEAVKKDFASVDEVKKQLVDAAMGQFGSGWAWLVFDEGKIKVIKTPNAETPITKGQKPLLTLDVWEHAYYLDYQNKRKDYAQAVVDKLLNWDFAAKNFG